jgi:4-hydroxy-4-methyl-2-oxoglutarate aldolase
MRREDEIAAAIRDGASAWELSGAAASYAGMEITEIDAAFDDPAA